MSHLRYLVLIIVGLLLTTREAALAAGPTIKVGANVQVSKAWGTTPHAEVVIVADPTRPERLLAASMAAVQQRAKDDILGTRIIVYASSDGGQTWAVSLEPPAKADPTLAYGPDGKAYLGAMADDMKVLLFYLDERGHRWERVSEGKWIGLDRPFLAVSRAGTRRGTVYLSGMGGGATPRSNHRPAVYQSDGALNFKLLHAWDPDPAQAGDNIANGQLAVLSDGTVVTSYPFSPFAAWKDSIKPVLSAGWRVGRQPTGDELSLMVRRIDVGGRLMEGQTPVQPHYLGTAPPAMAIDASEGPYSDRLYLTWSQWDQVGRRVMLSRSEDKGAHWSQPMPLSEQPTGGPAYHAFLPAVAVNKSGVVAVSWYDTRERERIGKPAWDVRLRVSTDGGKTWHPSVRVTGRTSIFDGEDREEEHCRILVPLWLGDTAGLCADADGIFHPLWIDNRTGERQVWTASVQVSN